MLAKIWDIAFPSTVDPFIEHFLGCQGRYSTYFSTEKSVVLVVAKTFSGLHEEGLFIDTSHDIITLGL